MKAHALMIGLLLSWLVSPESLAGFGRGVGVSGMMILVPLAAAMTLAILCTALIHNPGPGEPKTELAVLSTPYGRIIAVAMALTGRIPVFLFVSTAMLVSAGFAFNEIFVHWFPNFLFASLLLLMICGLHLFQEKTALWGLAFVLPAGWALLAVEHVPLARLAASSLPHMLIARAVGGDTGGYIIGVVVISGALSGVNGFLLALRKTLEDLGGNRFFSEITGKGRPGYILWFQSCIILGFLAFSFTWAKACESFTNKHINREE